MLMTNHLVGFGVGGGLTAVSFFDSAQATLPANIVSGDLIILGTYGVSSVSGYEEIVVTNDGSVDVGVFYKISSGSDSSTSPTGAFVSVVFRGNAPIKNVSINDVGEQATNGNPTAQVITSGSGIVPLISFGSYSSLTAISPRSMTPAKDGEQGNSGSEQFLAWKIYNASPANVSVDMDDEGTSNVLQSFYLGLS
jgi:hypothetical protein